MAGSVPAIPWLDTREAAFEAAFARLERRRALERAEVERVAAEIVEDVRQRGDEALLDAIERYDGYRLRAEELRVPAAQIEAARSRLDPADRDALALAAERIRAFHASHVPGSWSLERPGERLGQEVRALTRVGLYVPAFKAPLASSLLMLAVPAAVAGVRELVLCSPGRELHPAVLEAARLARVERVFRAGGAQAVAALAFGTETIPRVDKIVGPGNAWVQAAKRLVFGEVAIDAEYGPSEVLIVADASASPGFLAADLLAQAEHEEMASVVLVTPEERLARATLDQLAEQLASLPRREIAEISLRERSAIVVSRDIAEAVALANRYAAEHLQLCIEDAEAWLARVEHAGAVFLGHATPVPVGDYVAGPSHVLPTGGTARFFSPLGVEDFQKRMSVIRLEPARLAELGPAVIRLAELEGLHAHARAVARRLEHGGAADRPARPAERRPRSRRGVDGAG
jgi:histidinol dehydrogenase